MEPSMFTYSYLERLYHALRRSGYQTVNYHNYRSSEKVCILRHDVDFDLKKAMEMARFEYSNQVESTYFILLSTDFYNVFSADSQKMLKGILSCGHDIGLHFDETKYNHHDRREFVKQVEDELLVLGKAVGKRISSVSMHRPSEHTLGSNYEFENAVNSYSEVFFRKFKYISDSRMNWRENPLEAVSSGEAERLHLLTHPFWYHSREETARDKLLKFICCANQSRYISVNSNLRDLAEYVREDDVL